MIIRKQFELDNMHVVRNAVSTRCKYSIHAHSYLVEILTESGGLDNGYMLMDFGLFKPTIREFIKSFDNSFSLWKRDDENFIRSVRRDHRRVVTLPFSPSAESLALMMFLVVDKILENTQFANGEKHPKLSSVKVHETVTGYAEAFRSDLDWVDYKIEDIHFSDAITNSWTDKNLWSKIISGEKFVNEAVEQQVCKIGERK